MDRDDLKIIANEVARAVGRAVSEWYKKNEITCPADISASVDRPTLYVDDLGVQHTGGLVTVTVDIHDGDDEDDDY